MANSEIRKDMMYTIQLIRNFWPDLQFVDDELFSCKPEFIVRFFSTFLAELNDKLSYLINEEITTDEMDEIQDCENEIIIYCKTARFLKKINHMPLHLSDFYIPYVKKMYPYVKFCIHLVIFVNNILDDVAKISNENLKKMMDSQELKVLKQQCLQETAENAENLANQRVVYENLKVKLEQEQKVKEKMINDKIVEEKKTLEKIEELNALQNEIDNLEYELRLLEDKESNLKECMVTKSDIESIRNTEKYLEKELEFWDENVQDNISKHSENEERLKKFAIQLANISLENLDVETVLKRKQQAKQSQISHERIASDLNELDGMIIHKMKDVDVLRKDREQMQVRFTDLKNKLILEEQKDLETQSKETSHFAAKFEAYQKVQTEIANMEKDIESIKRDDGKLETAFDRLYQQCLVKDQRVTKEFYNTLIKLKGHLEKREPPKQ